MDQFFFGKIDAGVKSILPPRYGQIVGFCGVFRIFGGCIKIMFPAGLINAAPRPTLQDLSYRFFGQVNIASDIGWEIWAASVGTHRYSKSGCFCGIELLDMAVCISGVQFDPDVFSRNTTAIHSIPQLRGNGILRRYAGLFKPLTTDIITRIKMIMGVGRFSEETGCHQVTFSSIVI